MIDMLKSATQMVGFVAHRKAPRAEPLDDTDWMNIEGAHEMLLILGCGMGGLERPRPLRCYSVAGTTQMLRAIANRGGLIPGDIEAIHAACALLEARHG